MLAWAFIFLAIAIIAAIIGFTGVFSLAAGVAKIIFFIFIILAIIAFVTMLFRKKKKKNTAGSSLQQNPYDLFI